MLVRFSGAPAAFLVSRVWWMVLYCCRVFGEVFSSATLLMYFRLLRPVQGHFLLGYRVQDVGLSFRA